MSQRWSFALVAFVLTGAGCGDSHGQYPVSGRVLSAGEPARGAMVYFHRKDATDRLQEHVPQGVVGEDGTFTLTTALGPGARPGEYTVLIEWKESPRLNAPDRLGGRCMDPNTTPFWVEVKAEKNLLSPFELP